MHTKASALRIPVVNPSRTVSGMHQRMMTHKNAGLEYKTPLLVAAGGVLNYNSCDIISYLYPAAPAGRAREDGR